MGFLDNLLRGEAVKQFGGTPEQLRARRDADLQKIMLQGEQAQAERGLTGQRASTARAQLGQQQAQSEADTSLIPDETFLQKLDLKKKQQSARLTGLIGEDALNIYSAAQPIRDEKIRQLETINPELALASKKAFDEWDKDSVITKIAKAFSLPLHIANDYLGNLYDTMIGDTPESKEKRMKEVLSKNKKLIHRTTI